MLLKVFVSYTFFGLQKYIINKKRNTKKCFPNFFVFFQCELIVFLRLDFESCPEEEKTCVGNGGCGEGQVI